MQPLERPAAGDEAGGQVVEQLRMRGRLALHAKVARRAYKWLAEMPRPDAVRHDARRQRGGIAKDLIAQLAAARAGVEGGGVFRKHRKKSARGHFTRTADVTAGQHVHVAGHTRLDIDPGEV